VRREGDAAIVELLRALEQGGPLEGISGLSYKIDGAVVHNKPGEVPENIDLQHDLDIIHGYPKDDGLRLLLQRGMTKVICVQATRGCPYRCSFCVDDGARKCAACADRGGRRAMGRYVACDTRALG
jgi:radical SAM superfamily enzyme YgiQ (UPF0313 family)